MCPGFESLSRHQLLPEAPGPQHAGGVLSAIAPADHPLASRVLPRLDELVERARRTRSVRPDGPTEAIGPAPSGQAPPGRAPSGLLVALSGGPDSTALLLLARAWARRRGRPLAAAHLDHRLRGADARADAGFCRDLCARLEVPLLTGAADPRPLARRRGRGLEEAARHLRRRFLRRALARRPELACVATGHQRDDQVETVLMRLFRGTGPAGLRGIRPVAGVFIHPLLEVGRAELIGFLQDVGQPYRLDRTNETGAATRSRVRRELLPLARDIFGEGCAAGPARLAGLLEDDLELLDRLAGRALRRLLSPPAGGERPGGLDIDGLLALPRPLAARVLRRLARRLGGGRDLGRVHLDAVLGWLPRSRSGSRLDLPGGWRALREFDRLRLLPTGPALPAPEGTYRLRVSSSDPAPDEVATGGDAGAGARPRADAGTAPGDRDADADAAADVAARGGWRIDCPAANLHGPLRLRPWRPGDRIALPGLGGRKKVSDLLRERRVGVGRRPGVLVVEDDEGLLWVVGIARAERTLGLPTTRRIVTIAVAPDLPGAEGGKDRPSR